MKGKVKLANVKIRAFKAVYIVSVMPQLPKSNLAVLSKWEKKYFCLYNV